MKIPREILGRDWRPHGAGRASRAVLLALGLAMAAVWIGWPGDREAVRAGSAASPTPAQATTATATATARATAPPHRASAPSWPAATAAPAVQAPAPPRHHRHAEFRGQRPPPVVREVADWAVDSGDHGSLAFAVVDKRGARVWLFDEKGVLVQQAPALFGAAVGDDPVPGIGEKPLSQVRPEEKTTPAGRFVAEPGVNSHGEDIVWVSYDLAVSMHRVRPLVKAERRLQRLASPTARDNRISFGCINLPVAFYEKVFAPLVRSTGAVIYVLPETRTAREQFGSYPVPRSAHRRSSAAPPA